MSTSLDQKVKIHGKSGWLRWNAKGYWAIHLDGFTDREAPEDKFNAEAIEAAKVRLMERVRAHFKTKKERK